MFTDMPIPRVPPNTPVHLELGFYLSKLHGGFIHKGKMISEPSEIAKLDVVQAISEIFTDSMQWSKRTHVGRGYNHTRKDMAALMEWLSTECTRVDTFLHMFNHIPKYAYTPGESLDHWKVHVNETLNAKYPLEILHMCTSVQREYLLYKARDWLAGYGTQPQYTAFMDLVFNPLKEHNRIVIDWLNCDAECPRRLMVGSSAPRFLKFLGLSIRQRDPDKTTKEATIEYKDDSKLKKDDLIKQWLDQYLPITISGRLSIEACQDKVSRHMLSTATIRQKPNTLRNTLRRLRLSLSAFKNERRGEWEIVCRPRSGADA